MAKTQALDWLVVEPPRAQPPRGADAPLRPLPVAVSGILGGLLAVAAVLVGATLLVALFS